VARCIVGGSLTARYIRFDLSYHRNAFSKVQDAVKNAQATAVQVTTLVDTAMRLSPTVMPVGNIDVQEKYAIWEQQIP
jgi:hypothetical protein